MWGRMTLLVVLLSYYLVCIFRPNGGGRSGKRIRPVLNEKSIEPTDVSFRAADSDSESENPGNEKENREREREGK